MTSIVDKYIIPKAQKRTTKYSEADREKVKSLHKNGMSIHSIAKEIPMSKRMVQFILYPERAELAKKNFAKRQKTGVYRYETSVQSSMVRKVRERKKQLLKNGYLIKKEKHANNNTN
jgi:hypothetical protein